MGKHSRDQTHYFITKALTSDEVNLSLYKDEDFKIGLRLVAIESILAILQKINSKQESLRDIGEAVPLDLVINITHPITGLSMLDYCMVAGLNDLAMMLVKNGATSKNLKSFSRNISHSFDGDDDTPEILNDIRTITAGCMEIKENYDQFVEKNNRIVPKVVKASKNVARNYRTAALIVFSISCLALTPALLPIAHGASIAALISASVFPSVATALSLITCKSDPRTETEDSEHKERERSNHKKHEDNDFIQGILQVAKQTKQELQALSETTKHKHRRKHSEIEEPQIVTLFQHLAKNKTKHSINAAKESEEIFRHSHSIG